MKKAICALLILFMAASAMPSFGTASSAVQAAEPGSTKTKKILLDELCSPKHPKPRSVVNYVDAWIQYDLSQIRLDINYDLGEVSVQVTDADGNLLQSGSCDSSVEGELVVPLSLADGTYVLTVTGDQYESVGEFEYYE